MGFNQEAPPLGISGLDQVSQYSSKTSGGAWADHRRVSAHDPC